MNQGENRTAAGLVVFQHPEAGLYQQLAESLDTLRASPEMEIFHEVEQDESVIERVAAAQREELESEITGLKAEAREAGKEIEELVGSSPFRKKTRSETLRRRTAAGRHSHAEQAAEEARELAGEMPI